MGPHHTLSSAPLRRGRAGCAYPGTALKVVSTDGRDRIGNMAIPLSAQRRRVIHYIQCARRPLIVSHRDPDPDAVGSALALAGAIEQQGGRPLVAMDSRGELAAPLNELPGAAEIVPLCGEVAAGRGPHGEFDVVFVVDTADPSLLGPATLNLDRLLGGRPVVVIDHHVSNRRFGTVNYVDPQSAATGEVIWSILAEAKAPVTPEMATNLQAGIVGDTLGFQIASTTPRTLRAAANLVERGGRTDGVPRRALKAHTFIALRLLGSALETAQISEDGRIVWTSVTREMAAAIGAAVGESQGIANELQEVVGADAAAVFYEVRPQRTRVSLRSTTRAINAVAEHFGGGGHARAAGCVIDEPLATAREHFLARLRSELAR